MSTTPNQTPSAPSKVTATQSPTHTIVHGVKYPVVELRLPDPKPLTDAISAIGEMPGKFQKLSDEKARLETDVAAYINEDHAEEDDTLHKRLLDVAASRVRLEMIPKQERRLKIENARRIEALYPLIEGFENGLAEQGARERTAWLETIAAHIQPYAPLRPTTGEPLDTAGKLAKGFPVLETIHHTPGTFTTLGIPEMQTETKFREATNNMQPEASEQGAKRYQDAFYFRLRGALRRAFALLVLHGRLKQAGHWWTCPHDLFREQATAMAAGTLEKSDEELSKAIREGEALADKVKGYGLLHEEREAKLEAALAAYHKQHGTQRSAAGTQVLPA